MGGRAAHKTQRWLPVAKLRSETVSEVVRATLRDYIQEALDDARDLRELQALEARIDAGLEPLYDHDEVWAEIEALSDQTVCS